MSINRKFFFDHVRLHLFDGSLKSPQVQGLSAILDEWESTIPKSDDRWLAYMLATAHHETGRTMQPVRETFALSDAQAIARLEKAYSKGQLPWVKTIYWRPDSQGRSWLGRGLVQLTHKDNYEKLSGVTGVDLVKRPDLAMDMAISCKILVHGMLAGSFTGKKCADYFDENTEDWYNARRIINYIDKAALVGSYGKSYYAAISYTTS